MGFDNGKLVEVVLKATSGTLTQVNTFHYDLDDNNDVQPNDPQSLADTFRDDVRPHIIASMTAAWTVDSVVVTQVKDPLHPLNPRSSWSSGSPAAGTKTGVSDPLPNFCSPLVSLRTGHIGRRFRGRLWLMGIHNSDDQTGGTWESAVLTDLQTLVDFIPFEPDIAGPGSGATAKWCVYSRTQRAANLDPYASAITVATVTPLVHSLRSRAIYA
jgi:hypothetical protein